ncbi:agmatine deiminase family protein [Roseospira navarrensis]|uniref:Agmatine deiminase n=1 Tax=Roseospira navarrensis TaxID=140058 RepID=A0A7X1ZBY9_9PROT|nr:agmatine deiminase family protein [Roseospira navarrensis]MQX35532.1 agmatine deiminase [Roseospira navarrensis]
MDPAHDPGLAGFRLPAETEGHVRCWMCWPSRPATWGAHLDAARDAFAAVARAIRAFEPVTLVARPDDAADAARRCGADIEVMPHPIVDCWARDSGPTFVVDDAGTSVAIDWVFNGWGGKAPDLAADDALAAAIAARAGARVVRAPLVMEGGALCADGEGTLLVTEQCLLNSNRNPGLDRAAIERHLRDLLGVDTVVWLPHGLADDGDTDGHVDMVACFARAGLVLMVEPPRDPAHPDHARLRANLAALQDETDAYGRQIDVLPLPYVPAATGVDGRPVARSYVNFYVAGGGIVMPGFGLDTDALALEMVREAFPYHDVVMMPEGALIARGGGNIHCITQQEPHARPKPGCGG